MEDAASLARMKLEQDQRISAVVKEVQSRLLAFIRRRVPDSRDAEDILQDVFYELVEANRLLMPIDHVSGWLFRVARNRIIDLFRKKKVDSLNEHIVAGPDTMLELEDLLPSPAAGPDAVGSCQGSLAGMRSASGRRLGFWPCAESSSVAWDATRAIVHGGALAWASAGSR